MASTGKIRGERNFRMANSVPKKGGNLDHPKKRNGLRTTRKER